MGLTFSSTNYNLVHIYTKPNETYCCSLGSYDYIFNNETPYFIFKENSITSPKWIFYNGNIRDIMNSICNSNLINENLLIEKGKQFDMFYDMVSYIETLKDTKIKESIISYQRQNIEQDYINSMI
tara:strand:+ start:1863 stop:2237 length:375 start_codon:yes stop_codon:yes gene_type:complete